MIRSHLLCLVALLTIGSNFAFSPSALSGRLNSKVSGIRTVIEPAVSHGSAFVPLFS